MRNGQKPRQEHAAETVGDLAAVPETEAHNLKDLRPVPADDGLPAYDGMPDYEGVPVDDRLVVGGPATVARSGPATGTVGHVGLVGHPIGRRIRRGGWPRWRR